MAETPHLISTKQTALRGLRQFARAINRIFGIQGHAEFLRKWCARHFSDDLLIEDFDGSLRFWCRLDEHIGSQIFWRGSYSSDQLAFLDERLRPEMAFVDVGANQGEFSVFAGKRLTRGRVVAIEPVRALRERLERNVSANGLHNVVILDFGLGERIARLPIYGSDQRFSDGTVNSGLPSLYADDDRSHVVDTIDIRPLDQLGAELQLERLDFIKIDVEGAELSVLRGGEATIRRHRPCVLLELDERNCRRAGYEIAQLVAAVEALGYQILRLTPEGRLFAFELDELAVFQNVVCRPKE